MFVFPPSWLPPARRRLVGGAWGPEFMPSYVSVRLSSTLSHGREVDVSVTHCPPARLTDCLTECIMWGKRRDAFLGSWDSLTD